MPKSRKRRKPEPSPKAKSKGWWARNGGAVKQGLYGGIMSGCMPVLAMFLALPVGLFF